MKIKATSLIGLWLFGLLTYPTGFGQAAPERLEAISTRLAQMKAFSERIPAKQRKMLSSGALGLFQVADKFDDVERGSRRLQPALSTPMSQRSRVGVALQEIEGLHTVSDPGQDVFSVLSGFTHPVLGCVDANNFYYASLFETGPPSAPVTAVSVSKSTDGGLTFADPVEAVAKDGFTHFLDKDWMAIDPTNPLKIYVTYTDFDTSGVCGPPTEITRVAIELVRTTNGGATWSTPIVIDQVCSPFSVPGLFVQGSQVAVDARGKVYVAWEFYAADNVTREIRIRKSDGEDNTFGPKVKVSDVVCSGDCSVLQGGFRADLDLQSMAVDRSATPTKGNVYIAWHDSRFVQFPDLASPTGFYGYADALVSASSNGGKTWSAPVRINQNVEPLPNGRGTDQYMPGVAVDKTGRVASCFYDRRLDSSNFFFNRFCAVSTDGAQTWADSRQTRFSSAPFHATDTFIQPLYMGDYDGVASDFTGINSGFVGAFQIITNLGDPNVFAVKLP